MKTLHKRPSRSFRFLTQVHRDQRPSDDQREEEKQVNAARRAHLFRVRRKMIKSVLRVPRFVGMIVGERMAAALPFWGENGENTGQKQGEKGLYVIETNRF